ncbi:MAG: Alanine racemase 1 [Syntrophomonadaceae bacterium]|nr:Alanine racemase 1 [Bacillota bacterium]MBT9147828.1 Alanine racemase 1 [Bacillota bacterium]
MRQENWLGISLETISHNLTEVRRRVGREVRILCVVKADAYGHGICEVSHTLVKHGADYLAVSNIYEAVTLRKNGIAIPILVFGPSLLQEAEIIVEHQLTATVYEDKLPVVLSRKARNRRTEVKVHIEVDTGMGRTGVACNHAIGFVKNLMCLKNLKIEGIYTHFPVAEENREFSLAQVKDFQTVLRTLAREGIDIPLKHAANSAAILNVPESYFNLVRPGLLLYGIYPTYSYRTRHDRASGTEEATMSLLPALTLKTRIFHLRGAIAGATIGYGRAYTVKNDTIIAILPIGYANGYSRFLSNKGEVLVKGMRTRIVGRICMDQMMVDVGKVSDVRLGDEVVLIGKQGDNQITVEEVAQKAGTIPHDVVCQIGKGLPRRHKKLDD